MGSATLQAGVIKNLEVKSGYPEQVKCQFNPGQLEISRSNSWEGGAVPTANAPELWFKGGDSERFSLSLTFDTYDSPKTDKGDVRKITKDLWKLMELCPDLKSANTNGRPPRVQFLWGDFSSSEAVITNISERLTLFTPTGTPVRAELTVQFQQYQDKSTKPAQNPTSGGLEGRRLWTVAEGDTLAGIAYQVFGDANRWRPIADVNRLTRVRRLEPGAKLVIPDV